MQFHSDAAKHVFLAQRLIFHMVNYHEMSGEARLISPCWLAFRKSPQESNGKMDELKKELKPDGQDLNGKVLEFFRDLEYISASLHKIQTS